MAKRGAPESGFDSVNEPKRLQSAQRPSPTPNSNNVQSCNPVNPSSEQPPSPKHEPLQHSSPSSPVLDAEITDPAQSNPADEFRPDDSQRQEIANEALDLISVPKSDVEETSDPEPSSNEHTGTPDRDKQHESAEPEQPSPSPPGKKNKNKDPSKLKLKKKGEIGSYNPRLWVGGAQEYEAFERARKSGSLICGTTNITLDPEPMLVDGTLWKQFRLEQLPQLLNSFDFTPLSPTVERDDFLKACIRLGRCIHPEPLSRLLGGADRSPEYCEFLLRGLLGLINNPNVRRVLRNGAVESTEERHQDIVVHADQLYPSDDEILIAEDTTDSSSAKPGLSVHQNSNSEVAEIMESDSEEPEDHHDPAAVRESGTHESRHKDQEHQAFADRPSFVLRTFMRNLTGEDIRDVNGFSAYCQKAGIRFLKSQKVPAVGRLKWLTEQMPAPELGKHKTVANPLELWKYAVQNYSVKNLSRCALIRVNPLLDWLGFRAQEAEPRTSEEEFFRETQPVVSIAPIPLLYLADKAVDIALRVLSTAVKIAELNPSLEEEKLSNHVICEDDVDDAARHILQIDGSSFRTALFDVSVIGDPPRYNGEWPGLLQRPLTASENLELCKRMPKASISVPSSSMEEMRAVLMSYRACVVRKLYTNASLFENKDPLVFMSGIERAQSHKNRCVKNQAHGIKWSLKPSKNTENVVDKQDGVNGTESRTMAAVVSLPPTKQPDPFVPETPEPVGPADQIRSVQEIPGDPSDTVTGTGTTKLPGFFDTVNFAELIAFRIGSEELSRRKAETGRQSSRHENPENPENPELGADTLESDDVVSFLKKSASEGRSTVSTVCLHRLGWICLHALGIEIDEVLDESHPMSYAGTTNYTNFAQLKPKHPVTLTRDAIFCLARWADDLVRREANILMACAAHDEGRPWIDRADVALVTSVRKEKFCYNGL